ncbi:HNH endonuclease [Hydrocarboniphaga effusa]|uniref:HNH endonuclease n=1 Tax=Hydrocarboniphaga effusa TaxID=243629 RepID=UPI00058C2071|nr:HNH endonuclease signature motif containing protein [Hydrocarboniphaga effusa]
MKLRTLPSRLQPATTSRLKTVTTADVRISGRRLQERRKRIWQRDPNCARCGRLTIHPHGYELDHRVPLHQGGEDTDENCQVLCNGTEGCHLAKTREDAKA